MVLVTIKAGKRVLAFPFLTYIENYVNMTLSYLHRHKVFHFHSIRDRWIIEADLKDNESMNMDRRN
jgi:hypothetical protein